MIAASDMEHTHVDDAQRTVEIFAIGNELLVGQVQDTNTHWLIRAVTAAGGQVRRAGILRDDYTHICAEITAAVQRAPRLILTTGGLGPTDDDLTISAIGRTFGLEMREHPQALEWVRERYAYLATIRPNFSAELNAARRKMALFPVGARPIYNPSGAAPAMALDVPSAHPAGVTTIVSLPGVPSEMKAIFTTSLRPVLEQTIGLACYLEHVLVLDKGDESRIAELLGQLQARHPTVYVKSRGQCLEDGLRLTVVLSIGGKDAAHIRQELALAEQEAMEGLRQLGYTILRVVES
ncbi:MAG: competence/damage-inducible protein A [Thermoflexales bacterium]